MPFTWHREAGLGLETRAASLSCPSPGFRFVFRAEDGVRTVVFRDAHTSSCWGCQAPAPVTALALLTGVSFAHQRGQAVTLQYEGEALPIMQGSCAVGGGDGCPKARLVCLVTGPDLSSLALAGWLG